ncbi:hypothetical protein NIES4071_14800 [Calothrix sp. NIES-4071]|nr:hypothetical protein NIES4071_14800 [Calothrix sp. NIES-4071]BAZ55817.1 hypothetical protein NIES4105_14750 [Calothrix sp. NIES-4105]
MLGVILTSEDAFQHYLSITRSRSNSVLCTTDEQFETELLKRINRPGA